VGPRASLRVVERRHSHPYWESNPGSSRPTDNVAPSLKFSLRILVSKENVMLEDDAKMD
jgi:hypothetical protein